MAVRGLAPTAHAQPDGTTDKTTGHLTKPLRRQVLGYSHSTGLSKAGNQLDGYVEAQGSIHISTRPLILSIVGRCARIPELSMADPWFPPRLVRLIQPGNNPAAIQHASPLRDSTHRLIQVHPNNPLLKEGVQSCSQSADDHRVTDMKDRGIDLRLNSCARISAAIRNAFVIALLLGGAGCGGGGDSFSVTNGGPPISINDPANGFSTTETSIIVTGFVNRIDGSFPSGTVYWNNGSSSGSSPVTCGFLCCLFVCVGSWEATVPLNVGSNTITATFENASTSVTVTRIPVFAVSGKAYMQGTSAALTSPDVMVSRTDPASSTLYGTYLDSSGSYTFTGLLAGNYTVNPYLPLPGSSTCLTFTPASRTVSVSTTDVTGQDFAAATASPCYSIQGQITHNGNGVNSVSVYIQDSSGQSTYRATNFSGVYQFNYLVPGAYTITPQSCFFGGCITFSPASLTVTIVNTNVTGQDFAELY